MRRSCRMRRTRATTSWEVNPAGLSIISTPSMQAIVEGHLANGDCGFIVRQTSVFTLNEPVGKGAEGEQLRVEMEMTGKLRAKETGNGKGIVLEGQGSTASYSGLQVTDACGLELAARMKVAGRKISFEIADQGAHYP